MIEEAVARHLAETRVPEDIVILREHSQECEFGFYFATDGRAHQESGRFEDILGVIKGSDHLKSKVMLDYYSRSV